MHKTLQGICTAFGILALAAPAAAQFGGPPAPPNTGVPLQARLFGPIGRGQITVVVDPPKGTACYIMNISGLDQVTAAHIHTGGPGETGAPVLTLTAPAAGASGSCQPVAADLAQALLANPGAYYVNVHTQAAPNGAIRGQLGGELVK